MDCLYTAMYSKYFMSQRSLQKKVVKRRVGSRQDNLTRARWEGSGAVVEFQRFTDDPYYLHVGISWPSGKRPRGGEEDVQRAGRGRAGLLGGG